MHEIILPWDETDKIAVSNAIKRLFTLHNKASSKETVFEFVSALAERGLPPNAVIAGLRKLEDEELKTLNLRMLIDVSRSQIIDDKPIERQCQHCEGSGVIIMKSIRHNLPYDSAFGCTCMSGQDYSRRARTAQWNGQLIQYRNQYEYRLKFPDILEKKNYPKKMGVV